MLRFCILLTLTSCSFGYIRDIHELDKVISKKEVIAPSLLSSKISGRFYQWYFDEYEVLLSEEQKIGEVIYPKGSKVFIDTTGKYKRAQLPNGNITYDNSLVTNNKLKYLYSTNLFWPYDSSAGVFKYSMLPINFPKEITNEDFLIRVYPLFACTGEVEAVAVKKLVISGIELSPGDIVVLKSDKIWKIKNQVVHNELDKNLCGIFRRENYILKY